MASAETTGSGGWGLSWQYDGFGNRLQQNVTKGSMTGATLTVNAVTNRISSSGFGYDANGNQTQWPVGLGTATAGYDAQNRMTSVATANGTEFYGYSAANQRILIFRPNGTVETLFYGLGGELLGVYARTQKANGRYYVSSVIGTRVWFAGRMIESSGNAVVRDRLGSVEKNGSTLTRYYPYGEEQGGATAGNKEKFGTYTRDSVSGLDYAWNRYYSATWGRFATPDPYQASGGPAVPQSWNRYSHVHNDPVNFYDPKGLYTCEPGVGCREEPDCDPLDTRWAPGTGPCIAPSNGPSNYPAENRELIPTALSRALHALSLNKDCNELFGNDKTRARGFDPSAVLISLIDGGKFGQIKFENKGSEWGVAETRPSGKFPVPGLAGKVTITINTFNDAVIYWNDGNTDENARTLLHELGHASNFLRGAGGFAVSNLKELSDPQAFDKIIEEKCISR